MICWLASYPRSGNTFLRLCLERMYGITTSSVYPDRSPLNDEPTQEFVWWLHDGPDRTLLLKTHEQDHAMSDWPAIHLVRDGRDALVSHAHYRRVMDKDYRPFAQVLKALVVSPDWSLMATMWRSRAAKTQLIRFEDLIAHPRKTIRQAVEALGLPFAEKTDADLASFEQLHSSAPRFYRRGIVGSHRDEMPRSLEQLFWSHHGEAMKALGYQR